MYTDLETLLRTTIARNPGSSVACNYLGEILFRQEHVDEALSYTQRAVTLNSDSAEANSNLANILRYQKRFDEAIAYYKKASGLRPDIASIHGSLANTLLDAGKVEEAVLQYETALRAGFIRWVADKQFGLDPCDLSQNIRTQWREGVEACVTSGSNNRDPGSDCYGNTGGCVC